ncbi:MAG: hypothetical protein HC892_17540 [Saprospiraceae bacterium]|nr:hypothetical protein [Saprospiraceae bacterium]
MIRRFLLFIPVFLLVSFIVFGLSKQVPGDTVLALMQSSERNSFSANDLAKTNRVYREIAAREGLDKPNFYFTLTTSAYPDTLHKIIRKDRRKNLKKIHCGVWELGSHFQLPSSHTTARTSGAKPT